MCHDGSASALITTVGSPVIWSRRTSNDDSRGAITHSASIPCVTSSITPESICDASSSPIENALTAYPASRAAFSKARNVLFGPFCTGPSISTPIRRARRVARARAVMLGA